MDVKRSIITLLFILTLLHVHSQEVSGIVRDEDGRPVFAAAVYPLSDFSKGVNTDITGNFRVLINGVHDTIVVSFIGFKSILIPAELIIDNYHEFVLIKDINLLDEITIEVKNPISQIFAVSRIEKLDIYFNPFSQGDALKAITALPFSTTTDESANPSLRGSSAARSSVIFNGVPIYNPVRNSQLNGIGNFSLFNTEIIDRQFVYASNPPLTYGNSSAGLIEVESRKEVLYNETQVSATMAGAGVLTSQEINDKSFIQAYSNLQNSSVFSIVNKNNTENLNSFSSLDFGINFRREISKYWSLNVFGYYIDEAYDVNVNQYAYDGKALSGSSRFFSIMNIRNQFKQGLLSIDFGMDRGKSKFTFGNLVSDTERNQNYLSIDYKYVLKSGWTFQAGADSDSQNVNSKIKLAKYYFALRPENPASRDTIDQKNILKEAYFYTTKAISKKWKISSGLRTNFSYLSKQVSLSFNLDRFHQFLISAGQYNSFTRPVFQQSRFLLLQSDQIAFDYTYTNDNVTVKAAAYAKRERGERTADFFFPVTESITQGIELFIDYQVNSFIGLKFSNAYINQSQKIYGNNYSGPYDLKYFLKGAVVLTYPKWPTFTMSYMARPGSTFNEIEGGSYHEETALYQPDFSNRIYGGQFASYNRLDLGINKFFSFRNQSLIVFANISNVLNSSNQQHTKYNSDYSRLDFTHYQRRVIFAGMVWSIRN